MIVFSFILIISLVINLLAFKPNILADLPLPDIAHHAFTSMDNIIGTNGLSDSSHLSSSNKYSVDANGRKIVNRNIYIIVAESQNSFNAYVPRLLPSILADVAVYCWKSPCVAPTLATESNRTETYYASYWNEDREIRYSQPFISTTPIKNIPMIPVKPRLFVVNEKDIGIRTTWTTARNTMIEYVKNIEIEQGWRFAYRTFVDDDVHLTCPRIQAVMANQTYRTLTFSALYISQLQSVSLLHYIHRLSICNDYHRE